MPDTTRRRFVTHLGAAALLPLAACGTAPAPREIVQAFAPTGRLRASINLGNPILARREPGSVDPRGVSVDLARSLAERLGVPLELIVVEAAAKSVEVVKSGQGDIGFFAVDPLRSDGIRFSAPYIQIEGAYLVKRDSPLTDNAQVDRSGVKVMVGRGSAYDLYLSRELKAAQILRAPTSPAVVDAFLAQGADVAAGVKQQLEADAARLTGLRLLPGRFMVIEQAMGVQANRGEAAQAYLRAFVEEAKASGFVADALKRHNIQGAIVATAVR
jgi:polar amino acid transport system substrate-binding protein